MTTYRQPVSPWSTATPGDNVTILAIFDEQSPNGSGLAESSVNSPIPSYSSFSMSSSTGQPLMTSSPVMPRSNRQARPTSSYYSTPSPLYSGSSLGQSASMDFPSRVHANPPPPYGRSVERVRESVVEVKNANNLPSNGLLVYSPSDGALSSSPPIRSSLRSAGSAAAPSKSNRVTLSPEVEKKLNNSERATSGRFARNSARKSRISENYYDAQDRLEEARQEAEKILAATPGRSRLQFLVEAPNETIITFPDDERTPMGVEVEPVFNEPPQTVRTTEASSLRLPTQTLLAVQISKIDSEGRIARDGRLKLGDRIVSIDDRPVSQMSIHRARAYLADLQEKVNPSLTVDRPISSFQEESSSLAERNVSANSSQRRPILSALQKANTKNIGATVTVDLTKSSTGFGFTVTGRETAAGERLFYIGTVKPNGVALGHLRAGDRLLEINREKTSDLTQPEVVERLKRARIGETVSFLVSRVEEEDKENKEVEPAEQSKEQSPATKVSPRKEPHIQQTMEEHEFVVPLNSTGSAGLGISLKARVTVRSDKSRQDCGVFVKDIITGGAAFKDGRLRVDDRIVGIDSLRLDEDSNKEASQKISSCFKTLGTSSQFVRVVIQRKVVGVDHGLQVDSADGHSHAFTASPSPISLRFSQSSEEKRSSITSDIRVDEMDSDAFDREAPTRKSISEKRGMGTTNDPNHIKLFQDIKHQRQTSAPPISSPMTTSFPGPSSRSASQRAAARARSQSVHPRSPTSQPPQQTLLAPTEEQGHRRSLSMESINRTPQNSRQEPSPHPYPPGTEISVERRQNGVNRDRTRRKSVGSAVKSWFGFSKDGSLDREPTRIEIARQEEEDRRRVQEHYERLRQREATANRNVSLPQRQPVAYSPQQVGIGVIWEKSMSLWEFRINELQLPSPPPLIISNSRFYASQRARSQTTTTTISTTGTTPTATPRSTAEAPQPDPNRRPIITHFPVEDREPTRSQPATPPTPAMRKSVVCQDDRLPTTTTCSTRGSHTVVGVPWEPRRSSRQRLEVLRNEDHADGASGAGRGSNNSNMPNQRPPQNLHNSTPITFPTTRFAFTPSSQPTSTGTSERLSMRARKNKRREVVSLSNTPIPRKETTIDEPPSSDYCSVWNQWNIRTGASLPARRPRPPRPKLNQTTFEAITDC